MGLWRR